MELAEGKANRVGDARDRKRDWAAIVERGARGIAAADQLVRVAADAEFRGFRILSPALNRAVAQQCAGEIIAGANSDGIRDARDGDRGGAVY